MRLPGRKQATENQSRQAAKSKSAVFSYYARGASPSSQNTGRNESSSMNRAKGYRLKFGHTPSYIALGAILLALVNASLLDSNPKIVLVQTSGTVHRDPKTYQAGIEEIWKKSPFNRTKLTVSTDKIEQEISDQFAELSSIQIELPLLGKRPYIRITSAQPAIELVSVNGSFYVDNAGLVLARTSDLSKNQLDSLAVVRDESGLSAEPGKIIMSAAQVEFLQKLYAQLRAESVVVSSIILPKTAANQADLRVDGQSYYVKFSLDSDPRQAVGTYLAAKKKLEAESIKPAEYMDVRISEKAFYK